MDISVITELRVTIDGGQVRHVMMSCRRVLARVYFVNFICLNNVSTNDQKVKYRQNEWSSSGDLLFCGIMRVSRR